MSFHKMHLLVVAVVCGVSAFSAEAATITLSSDPNLTSSITISEDTTLDGGGFGMTRSGSQCITVAIDARRREDRSGWDVYVAGGRKNTGLDAVEWARRAEELGAGEILLTSMDRDGTKAGYDLTWFEGPGAHEWDFWDSQIHRLMDWLPLEEGHEGLSSGHVNG